MSGRGELVGFYMPLERVRSALARRYSVSGDGPLDMLVRDRLDKLVCRIRVLVAPGDSFWLTLEPLRGYAEEADRIRRMLLDGGFLPEEAWKSVEVPMRADERADGAVARVLTRLLEIQDANLPGTLAGSDVEFLHDLRVAIRRTRSVLREMRGVFAPEELRVVRGEFKWLQDQTSATRDLDVYLHDFDELRALAPSSMQDDLEPLLLLLRSRQRRARRAMEQSLTGGRARSLHADWSEILRTLVLQSEEQRPDAARPIAELTAERIRRVHHRMVRMGREIGPESPPEHYHELRKKGKELRYLLELFAGPLLHPEVVRPLIRALKALQDVLGLHQDREVQIEMLKELSYELAAQPGGPRALMAVGALIERLEADAARARANFADSFAQFASAEQCKLVKDAFS